jgi:hypothetical protein
LFLFSCLSSFVFSANIAWAFGQILIRLFSCFWAYSH